jgi:hypothetical protein
MPNLRVIKICKPQAIIVQKGNTKMQTHVLFESKINITFKITIKYMINYY